MGQLHNTLIRQAVATQPVDLGIGHSVLVFVDLQRVCEQRLQTVPVKGIRSVQQQVADVVLCSTQPMVHNGAKGSGTIGAAAGLRDQNADVLNPFHSDPAHFPQHLGGAELGGKELREIKLRVKVIWHVAFHLSDPDECTFDRRVGNLL